jgi:hypothetical protein
MLSILSPWRRDNLNKIIIIPLLYRLSITNMISIEIYRKVWFYKKIGRINNRQETDPTAAMNNTPFLGWWRNGVLEPWPTRWFCPALQYAITPVLQDRKAHGFKQS